MLVEHQGVQDIILVDAAAVKGAVLRLAVVEHAVRDIVHPAVGQKLVGQQVINDLNAARVRVNALQTDVAEHHGIGVDVEKAPILLRRQRTFPDGLFNRLRLAGALPVVAAVVPTGHVFVGCVGVQNVRLLLQLAVIGVKIVAVQIADIAALGLVKKPPADGIHPPDALVALIFFARHAVHDKDADGVRVRCLPAAQLFNRAVVGAVVRAEDFHGEIGFLRQHAFHRLVHKGGQIVKRDQHTDLGLLCHAGSPSSFSCSTSAASARISSGV